MLREVIHCRGHRNVRATHGSTLEFTKEDYLTPRGDCILCVGADRGIKEFSDDFKGALKTGRKLLVRIKAGDMVDEVLAEGSPDLILDHEYSMVVRKSDYVDARTIAVRSNKAARDISRKLVALLKRPETEVEVEFIVL